MVILVLVSRWVAWIGRSGCLRGSLLYPHVWAKGLPYREVAPSFLVAAGLREITSPHQAGRYYSNRDRDEADNSCAPRFLHIRETDCVAGQGKESPTVRVNSSRLAV